MDWLYTFSRTRLKKNFQAFVIERFNHTYIINRKLTVVNTDSEK